MTKPSFLSRALTGALVGLLLTIALAALLFAAQRLFGLPFVPFGLFDWLARVLPGPVVTFTIELMTRVISGLGLGELSEVAKVAERGMAVTIFLLLGAAGGAVLLPIFARRNPQSNFRPGMIAGGVIGLVVAVVGLGVGQKPEMPPFLAEAWVVLAFGVWGGLLGWIANRLYRVQATSDHSSTDGAERLDRRRFLLRLGGATAVVTVVGAGVAVLFRNQGQGRLEGVTAEPEPPLWSELNPLPNSDAEVQPVPGTRPEFTVPDEHYRIDINLRAPVVDGESWRLRVGGLVESERAFDLEQLRSYEAQSLFITLSCISNPLGGNLIDTTRWTGVSLQRLLPDLDLRADATHLKISSVDGFSEIISLETVMADERVMLAYDWDGRPLPVENGFPLRIYIPDVYGMKQPKWISRIEAIDDWEAGYWVERGWDAQAQVRATSVIDTVASDLVEQRDGVAVVPVGGIAHAGARGISRVEVRVDEGEWQEARLREPLSNLTWVIWRFDWPFEPGEHIFRVRCFDGNGEPQIAERNPPHPSGATGLVRETVRL